MFVIGNGTSTTARSNALRVSYLGNIYGTKAFQSSGADYAEFIKPWADGNPDAEDRIGYFVTVKDGFLEKAAQGDLIAGITSGKIFCKLHAGIFDDLPRFHHHGLVGLLVKHKVSIT